MTTRAAAKNRVKKPLETTLGKVPPHILKEEPFDLSHLQKPIQTSVFGLKQVLSLFHTATDEVKKYVAYECDIMYECRVCRSIFRSLANFILHKRKYCQERFSDPKYWKDEEESDVEISQPPESEEVTELKQTKSPKTLSSVLDNLLNKQKSALLTQEVLSGTPEDSKEISSETSSDRTTILTLERIKNSDKAIFQTVHKNMPEDLTKPDLMRSEVMEIHSILDNDEAILDPDGKIMQTNKVPDYLPKSDLVCTVCNQRFSTKKTLTCHIKYKHNKSRLVYPCPECKDTLSNTWCVFRHLCKVHRKTTSEIKKLRGLIHASAIIKEQETHRRSNGPHKLRNLTLRETVEQHNQQWIDDFESANDLQMCGGCGRRFERKAALHSHSQICTKRIALCNAIKENVRVEGNEEEKEESRKSPKAPDRQVQNPKGLENELKGAERRKPVVLRRNYKSIIQERRDYIVDKNVMKRSAQNTGNSDEIITISDDSEEESNGCRSRRTERSCSEYSVAQKENLAKNDCDIILVHQNLGSDDMLDIKKEPPNPNWKEVLLRTRNNSKPSGQKTVINQRLPNEEANAYRSSMEKKLEEPRLLEKALRSGELRSSNFSREESNDKQKRAHSNDSTNSSNVKAKKVCHNENKTGDRSNREQESNCIISETGADTISKDKTLPDMQDPVVRKMVFEVIFGPTATSETSVKENVNTTTEVNETKLNECKEVTCDEKLEDIKSDIDSEVSKATSVQSKSQSETLDELLETIKGVSATEELFNDKCSPRDPVESICLEISSDGSMSSSNQEIRTASDIPEVNGKHDVIEVESDSVDGIEEVSFPSSKVNCTQRPIRSRTTNLHKDFLYEIMQNKPKTIKVSEVTNKKKLSNKETK